MVEDALAVIGCHAVVVSLDPGRLDEVIDCIGSVGRATRTDRAAEALMADLRRRVAAVRTRVEGRRRPRVFALEWPDPPFNGGHWVPDMIEAAGGVPVLAASGERSRRLAWDEIAAEWIDVTVFMPCGFDLDGAVEEAESFLGRPEAATMGRYSPVDPGRVLLPARSASGRRRRTAGRGLPPHVSGPGPAPTRPPFALTRARAASGVGVPRAPMRDFPCSRGQRRGTRTDVSKPPRQRPPKWVLHPQGPLFRSSGGWDEQNGFEQVLRVRSASRRVRCPET